MALVKGYSLTTGWGEGLQSLPTNARDAANGRRILPAPTPVREDDRLRRATRECVLAVAAVEQALANSAMTRDDLEGPRTALIYASASAYASANWSFLTPDQGTAMYFPYTAPSAVPGEVTIQYGITGPYLSFLSGANAGIEALWHAATLLTTDQCDRALILGVETFMECEALYTAGRWLLGTPLVETAICLIVERHVDLDNVGYKAGNDAPERMVEAFLEHPAGTSIWLCTPTSHDGHSTAQQLQKRWPDLKTVMVSERVGTCLASTALVGLLLSLAEGTHKHTLLMSRWWDAWSILRWPTTKYQKDAIPNKDV